LSDLAVGDDGVRRCSWPGEDPLYVEYHDGEWGMPVTDDRGLFERIVLEGFQAGLSWITVLRKREAFREGFARFDHRAVAGFGEPEVERLLEDERIIRNRAKIGSAINNATAAEGIIEEFGSLAAYLWPYAPEPGRPPRSFADLEVATPASKALSKDLKARGWSFVGPTTMHAMMQSIGMINDHLEGCVARERCEKERTPVLARYT
jgi:DNA-3-methyladenine glycosylase I